MKKLVSRFGILAISAMCFAACAKGEPENTPTDIPEPTVTEALATATPTPTPEPTPTEAPTVPEGATLLNTYGDLFGYVGTCATYHQIMDSKTMEHLLSQYNSITLENEMKPDAILGGTAALFSKEDALQQDYVIPESYQDEMVPRLNFNSVDNALMLCDVRGISMRAHTLVWHSQTPLWFFKENFDAKADYVSPEVMDGRMEFYIRTVMGHVYDYGLGSLVYAWDVVNEYLHADDTNWKAVYGEQGVNPTFAKKAFEIAHDVLVEYGLEDEVSLFYNDFNTYDCTTDILALVEYINSDERVCDGIGMQSHLSTGGPTTIKYKAALEAFLNAGYEVQITELDVGNSGEGVQAMYYYELMQYILELKKNGANITGITLWGLSDATSWRRDEKPLLFSTPGEPKIGYEYVLKAYFEAGYTMAE